MHETCDNGNCPLEPRVKALERANEQNVKTHREIFDRMRGVEKESAVQAAQFKAIAEKLDDIIGTVHTLAAKPGKRWESLVGYALSALVGAFLLWVVSGMPGAK